MESYKIEFQEYFMKKYYISWFVFTSLLKYIKENSKNLKSRNYYLKGVFLIGFIKTLLNKIY